MNSHKAKLAGLLAALMVLALFPVSSLARQNALVSVDWLAANLKNPKVVVLDVSEFVHYERGHIPGAVKAFGPWGAVNAQYQPNMMPPVADLNKMISGYGVNQDSLVVVYDEGVTSDDTAKSARALWVLEALGHDNVTMLNGGYSAWKDAAQPVSTAAAEPVPGNFKGELVAARVADLNEVKSCIGSKRAILVDTRLPDEDFGHEKKSYVKRYGHLPHSLLWPASSMTNAGVNFSPSLVRDTKELEEMAQGVGLPANKDAEIITYSNLGTQAAMGYYILHDVLDYTNVKVFDGSIMVAAEDASVPMEKNSWGFVK